LLLCSKRPTIFLLCGTKTYFLFSSILILRKNQQPLNQSENPYAIFMATTEGSLSKPIRWLVRRVVFIVLKNQICISTIDTQLDMSLFIHHRFRHVLSTWKSAAELNTNRFLRRNLHHEDSVPKPRRRSAR